MTEIDRHPEGTIDCHPEGAGDRRISPWNFRTHPPSRLPLITVELGGITGGSTPVLGIQGEILRFNQHDKRTKESHFAMLWVAGRGSGMGIKNLPALSECGQAAWCKSQAASLPASNNKQPPDHPGHCTTAWHHSRTAPWWEK